LKIKSLYIKDFKNIKEISFDFTSRINLITGDTGNGKSAIFDAMRYLLIDELVDKIIEYVRWGQKQFLINGVIEDKGNVYDYSIVGDKGSSKRLIINNDADHPYINSEATKKFAEVLDATLTKFSAISEQGETTQLLSQKPAERLKTLKQILKIDSIFDAVENIKIDSKKLKEDTEKLVVEKTTLEARKFQYIEVQDKIDVLQLISQKFIYHNQQKAYEEKQEEVEQYEEDLQKYKQAVQDISLAESGIKEYDEQITKLVVKPVPTYDESELSTLEQDITELKIKKNQFVNDKKVYDNAVVELKKISDAKVVYQNQINEIALIRLAPCKFTQADVDDIQIKLNDSAVMVKQLENELELAKLGKCPTCKKDFIVDVSEIETKLVEEQKVKVQLTTDKTTILATIAEYTKTVEEQRILRDKKTALSEKIKFLETEEIKYADIKPVDGNDIETTLVALQSKLAELFIFVKNAKDIEKENASVQIKINEIHIRKESLLVRLADWISIKEPQIVINDVVYDEEKHKQVEKDILLAERHNEEVQRNTEFNNKLAVEEKEIKDRIKEIDKSIEKNRKEISILNDTANLLQKDFSANLISKGILFLKTKINEFFQSNYDQYEITVEQDNSSVDFFYSDGTNKLTPTTLLSGFEKDLCATAARIATLVLQPIGFFMGDELDSHASDSKSKSLLQSIINEKQLDQIFFISHNEASKEMLYNTKDCAVFEIINGLLSK
jgi:DNA repair exonuclease SbcCD ATPase subunit